MIVMHISRGDQIDIPNEFGLRCLERFGDRVMCFHLSDNDGHEDKHWNIGKGIIDWNRFITAFPREYHGILSAVTVPKEKNISEKEFIEDAYRRSKDLGHRIPTPR
jgi:sugar phosphate isomerase/epimerase